MADALATLAHRGGITSISNPVGWQRTTRRDRVLLRRKP